MIKLVVFSVLLCTFASLLHDPIHRRLIDDEEEERTWCLINLTSNVEIYNSFINIFHFIVPFLLQVISAIRIIISIAKQRVLVNKRHPHIQHIKEQCRNHKQSENTLIYSNKTFLTCRSPTNSFFLCQTLQNVYSDTKQIRIRWYSFADENQDENRIDENTHFKESYQDKLDIDTILTGIESVNRHFDKTITLHEQDISETKHLLQKSIKAGSNETSVVVKSPKSKKRKVTINIDAPLPARKRRRTVDVNDAEQKQPKKKTKVNLFKVQSNRFLKENQTVTEYEVDPFFESNVTVPFISSSVQSKLAIRAVMLNDAELLKSLIDDIDHVYAVHIKRDLPKSLSAIHYAVRNNNTELLKILIEDLLHPKSDRCPYPEVTLQKQTTGNASIRTLGFRTAEIMASRGAREGNNALLKGAKGYDNVIVCIQAGHRKLAASIMDDTNVLSHYGFNELHHQVLSFDQEDLTINSACDVIKQAKGNCQVTPIHCAAINPNAKYLKQLLAVVSEYNIADKEERKPIHYAAACEGSDPLEYLLSKDVKFNEADKNGNTPLHVATRYGRHSNAELLLRKAKEKAESNEPDDLAEYQKYGLASINRMNTAKQCPIHLAVINNHIECIEVLIQYGATIDIFTSVSKEKLTPLMFACQNGFLNIVKCLIKHGARVESRDRFKRTPLIHACMYGHAHIVSYLLRIGANPNVFDSSMNSALVYAVAYGWYFCVRLLMEAGANLNAANCWQVTCLGIGFSKGHYGICDYLLNEHQANINFKNDEGLTIVMLTVDLDISKSSVQQLEYAVVKHNADCTCVDINGSNAFHYLASKSPSESNSTLPKKYYFRMAQILLDHHCNPTQMNNKAQTPLMLALESKNFYIVNFLINQAKLEITLDINRDGKTLLHYFAMNSEDEKFVETLLNLPVTDDLKKMSLTLDNEGRTPFHYCTLRYEECFGRIYYDFENRLSQYQSISKMIRYFLDTLECFSEECIFHLLYEGPSSSQDDQHPLEIFLKKSKNINAYHFGTGDTPLLRVIHSKSYKIISILLQQPSCDVNVAKLSNTYEGGQTPLMTACKLQYFPAIRDLLNHPKCDLLAYDDQHNQALHYFLATSTRSDEYLEIFELFIEKLIAIGKHALNSKGKSGSTPLHIAVLHNQGTVDTINVVEQTLIDNGCDVFIKDDLGNIPLHNVFLGNKSSTDSVELCVLIMQAMNYESLDTKNNEGNTPLRLALFRESAVCIMLLLKRGANLLDENNLSNSVIADCIAMKRLNLLVTFLHQPIDIDLSKFYHKSAPSVSTKVITDTETWKWHFVPETKEKPLEEDSLISLIIRQSNWQGVLSLILDDIDRFHLKYIQVLEAAILYKQLNLVLRLMTTVRNQSVLQGTNTHEQNLFHIVTIQQVADATFLEKFFGYLYKFNIDWNVADKYGMYPLHYACILHYKSLIEFLRKKYPKELDFNQTDRYGNSAYALLFWNSAGNSAIDKGFLRTIIPSGRSLDCLCNYENRVVRNPLSFNFINASSKNTIPQTPVELKAISTIIRTSPLINAVVHHNFELTKFLLELGADVNFSDEEKLTPLMHAVRQNDLHMVKLLLNKDYTLDDDNRSSKTMSHSWGQNVRTKSKPKGFFLGATTTSMADDDNENEEEQQTENKDISDDKEPMNGSNKFKMTSNIDLDATDALGRTCIHHLVQPFAGASYVNCIEILELLHASGVSLTKPDRMHLSPLQYVAKNAGFRRLYDKLIELTNEQPMDIEDLMNQRFIVNDPNKDLLGQTDYYSDAQAYINQYIAARPVDDANSIHKVDRLSNMSETGDIVWDTDKSEPYDVRLTITDVDYGLIGLYNFYRMQIIKHKTKTNLYLLFTRWGRIGDGDGQHQLTPYSSLEECRAEFCKIFRDKTGNAWENTNRFEKKPKKYTFIQLSDHQTHKHKDVPLDFQRLENESEQIPSKLKSEAYKNFFKTFLNDQVIRENINKADLDIEWMPVSQLKTESLQRARDILAKLAADIEQKDKLKLIIQQATSDEAQTLSADSVEKTEFKRLIDSICQLTNEYYSIIPLQGYGAEKLHMIDTVQAIKIQEQKLTDIFELELSYKILLAAEANLNQISPLDYLYKSINCQFEAMNQNDIDSQFILRYIWASAPNTAVEQILKVARPNDDERLFQRNRDNHYLLWHGTNICNLISILTRGTHSFGVYR
ncbi:unnamed protein product [Rotaria sordida]|uniref:Poly [ADP-ribose] polymerase n=1 Tax=Rotaria sordida TaxID=392033 RepID=A0A819DC40_9BILA|nr:unnamed protein product [Rotaria sordida]